MNNCCLLRRDFQLHAFASCGVVTPNIKKTTDALHKAGIKCGVALFGETIFAMVDSETEKSAISILENFKECQIIKSRIDTNGARLQTIAPVISCLKFTKTHPRAYILLMRD